MKKLVGIIAILVLGVLSAGCFLNVTSYHDKDGSLVYVGEVTNDGAPLVDAQVEGTFVDANGNVIAKQSGPACRVMPSKFASAFKVVLPPGTAQPAKVEWKLTGTTVPDAALALGLSAQIFTIGPGGPGNQDQSSVVGEITNDSANTYQRGEVCAAWVNAKGEILRVAVTNASQIHFNPGDKAPFLLQTDIPPEATGVNFYLDAVVGDAAHPLRKLVVLQTSALQHAFLRSFPFNGGIVTAAVAEIHNNGTVPIRPLWSAASRDAAGHPTGVGDSSGLCNVPAPPGGFTFGGYVVESPGASAPSIGTQLEATESPATDDAAIPVSNVSMTTGTGGMAHVTATAKNTTSSTLAHVRTCAGVYDASGVLIGAFPGTATLPAGGLAPNSTVSFSIDVPALGTAATAKALASGHP